MTEETGISVRELLPGSFSRLGQTLQEAASRENGPGERTLPGFAWRIAGSEASSALQTALDTDVFSLLARGWGVARELAKYADRSKYPAAVTTIVYLGKHSVTAEVHPVLIVSIDGIEWPPFRFTLALSANFETVALVIRDAHIIGLDSGDCSVSAQLRYGEVPLPGELQSRHVALPGCLRFKPPGIAIGSPT